MASLNPNHLPDRFMLDRYARQMRNDELARVARAIVEAASALCRRIARPIRDERKPRARRTTSVLGT